MNHDLINKIGVAAESAAVAAKVAERMQSLEAEKPEHAMRFADWLHREIYNGDIRPYHSFPEAPLWEIDNITDEGVVPTQIETDELYQIYLKENEGN